MELLNPLSIGRGLQIFTPQKFNANCLSGDTVGKAVYVTGPKVGERYQVTTADPSDSTKMPSVGVIIEKSSPTECVVQALGEMVGIVTGLTPGRLVMIESDGSIGHTLPVPGVGATARIQYIGTALSGDAVFLCPNFLISVRRG